MPIWCDPSKKVPYVLKAERGLPQEQQTRYFFRVMSARDYGHFSDVLEFENADADGSKIKNWTTYQFFLLKYTLCGWEGPGAPAFEVDASGNPTDVTLTRIHFEDRWELCAAADEVNKVTTDDAGKSQP